MAPAGVAGVDAGVATASRVDAGPEAELAAAAPGDDEPEAETAAAAPGDEGPEAETADAAPCDEGREAETAAAAAVNAAPEADTVVAAPLDAEAEAGDAVAAPVDGVAEPGNDVAAPVVCGASAAEAAPLAPGPAPGVCVAEGARVMPTGVSGGSVGAALAADASETLDEAEAGPGTALAVVTSAAGAFAAWELPDLLLFLPEPRALAAVLLLAINNPSKKSNRGCEGDSWRNLSTSARAVLKSSAFKAASICATRSVTSGGYSGA